MPAAPASAAPPDELVPSNPPAPSPARHGPPPHGGDSNGSSSDDESSDGEAATSHSTSTSSTPAAAAPDRTPPTRQTHSANGTTNTNQQPLQGRRLRNAFAILDRYPAEEFLARPCPTFKSPPHFLRGPLRRALHFSLDQINASSADQHVHAWQLWLYLPRMLLHKPRGNTPIPKPQLHGEIPPFLQW